MTTTNHQEKTGKNSKDYFSKMYIKKQQNIKREKKSILFMRDKMRGENSRNKTGILVIASILVILVAMILIISSGALQQKVPDTNLKKITNPSSVGSGSVGGGSAETISSNSLSSSLSSSLGSGGGGGSSGGSSPSSGGVIILAAEGDPQFSNLLDNSGSLVGSGIAQMNVSITSTNGNAGIEIGKKNYSIDNNNWLDYDGVGDYVNYGNNAQFSTNKGVINSSISFYALITPKSTTKTMSAISKDKDSPVFNHEYDLQFDASGNIAFYVYQRSGGTYCTIAIGPVNGENPYVAGKTYFVYVEYINDTSCSLQVDGGDKLTSTNIIRTFPAVSGTANLKIGQRDSGANNFTGAIDNFAFYNKSLNPIQVNRIYSEKNLGQSVPVLSYHRVYNDGGAQEIVNKTEFAAQMEFLHHNGYETITYKQWTDWTNGIGTLPAKPVIIDFDDGWYNTYLNAYPVMNSYGYVGVAAVIGAALEGAPGSGEEEGAMNFAQLQVLANNGWEIASHSYTHPNPEMGEDIRNMTVEQRIFEFNDSKNLIENNLVGVKVSTFIYPFDISNIVTDEECGKYYSICSGYSAYPEHAGLIGDQDFFIFKSTNKIYSDGNPIGMRRVAISSYTTLEDFKYYLDYSDGQQINSQFNENSGSIAHDSSGKGNNGAITGATWNNTLYHKEIFLNPGVYPYYWWAYGNGTYAFSNIRSYTVYPAYVPNVSLQITSPTTAKPLNASSGSNISIYFNFLNSSYIGGQWLPKNVTSGVSINNVIIGGKLATILPTLVTPTSNTYNASKIYTKVTDNDLSQAPAWNDAWDGTENSGCYTSTSTSNNIYCTLSVSGGFFVRDREPWARFNFTIPEDVNTITSIKITAEAKADSSSSSEDVAFIIANFATHSWTRFESDTRTEVTRTVTYTTGFSDIIQNGQLVLLLEGDNLDDGESIGIDYVSIIVNATSSSGGKQFVYIPTKGWQVNVTAPNATDGLQDLSVDATWTSYYGFAGSDNEIKAVDYRTDLINPNIQIISPLNNTSWNINTLDINYIVSDANLQACWYTNDSYAINNTIKSITCGQNITTAIWSDGQHNVTVWARDISNNVNSSSVSFTIDATAPTATLLAPANDFHSNSQSNNFTANISDNLGLQNATLNIINSTGSTVNQTTVSYGGGILNSIIGTVVNLIDGAYTWFYNIFDNVGNNYVSPANNLTIDTTPPYFANLTNQLIYNNQSLNYDINATDEGVGLGSFAINWTNTFNIIPTTGVLTNISSLNVGMYYINVSVNDTLGNLNSAILPINVSLSADTIPPYFTAIPATTNVNYTQGFGVDFNASDERGFGTYAINWTTLFKIDANGLLTNSTSNIPAGNYYIKVTINDTSNNLNSTIYLVNVLKATPVLAINGTTPITYGTTTDVAGSGCASQLTCSLDKTNGVYGAGTVTFNYSTIGNANYSANSVTKTITINKAVSALTINGTTPITYGNTTDVAGSGCASQLTCSLSPSNGVYGAGTVTFNYSTVGNANYSASSVTKDIVIINEAIPTLTITGTTPITYGTATDVVGGGCPSQLTCSLDKTNGIYGAGSVTFNYSTPGNANYTASSITKTIIINKATSALAITGTTPIVYGTATDVVGSGCASQLTCSLSPTNGVYSAGTVTFNYSTLGNANYSASSVTKIITINKAPLIYVVSLTSPINYPTASNYLGRITNGEASCSPTLYRNGMDIANGFSVSDTAVLGIGTYTYRYSTAGCVNYIDSENIKTLIVGAVACYSNSQCDDSNTHTQDICNNAGTTQAACSHLAISCLIDSECDDSNPHTQDVCSNAGTPSSSCSHPAIACLVNSECDDSNPHTQDVCNNPGTTQSSCTHPVIVCLTNTECGTNGFTNTPVCQSDNVWQNFITYTCNNAGTSSSSCTDSTALQSKETCAGGCIDGRCKVKSCTTVCNYGVCKEYCVWQ